MLIYIIWHFPSLYATVCDVIIARHKAIEMSICIPTHLRKTEEIRIFSRYILKKFILEKTYYKQYIHIYIYKKYS